MNLTKMIDELRNQRGKLDVLIRAVQDYAGETPRRGRPPKWLTEQRKAAAENGGSSKKKASKKK